MRGQHGKAQDPLRVLTIDYMGEALERTGVLETLDYDVELTVLSPQDFSEYVAGGVTTEGKILEYDMWLVDNFVIEGPELEDFVIPVCEIIDCDIFTPPDRCGIIWRFGCPPPCPLALSCPIVWDVELIIDPWPPMPWTIEELIEVVEREPVMVDPRNAVGFFLEPAIFEYARPNLTLDIEEAYMVFTAACNYVMHYEEFTEAGFLPIEVAGYEPATFNVNPYVMAEGNVELTADFVNKLYTDIDIQLGLFEATGLLPSNVDALNEILPGPLSERLG